MPRRKPDSDREKAVLLLDIGNTHTHAGLGMGDRVLCQKEFRTTDWLGGAAERRLFDLAARKEIAGCALCSVVPAATHKARPVLRRLTGKAPVEVGPENLPGIEIDYPRPKTIGPDRLANAVAAYAQFGAPNIVVDFGTAVTFDILDSRHCYVGGIIAPGLSAMTEYLHERTALLPRVRIRDVRSAIGKSTVEAMLVGAVHGYRGLIRGLLEEVRRELGETSIRVVATGGYAQLMAEGLPEIQTVRPELTLEGVHLVWKHARAANDPRLSQRFGR